VPAVPFVCSTVLHSTAVACCPPAVLAWEGAAAAAPTMMVLESRAPSLLALPACRFIAQQKATLEEGQTNIRVCSVRGGG
jgi:hypothetical protein